MPRLDPLLVGLFVASSLPALGCVPKARYEECVAGAEQARAAAEAKQRDDASHLAALQQQLTEAQNTLQQREGQLNDLSTSNHNVQAQLDEATAINAQLRGELQRLGTDVDKMLAEKGTLSKALDDAKARLDELRKAQAEGDARAQLFRDFQQRFKPLVDSGQLRIDTKRGELVMNVQGDLLFDEGRTDLRTAGRGALMEIARAIQITSPPATGRRFLVTADVDAVDPAREKAERAKDKAHHAAPSPWELTAARAVAVVEFLISLGVPATSLTAAAAGASDPLAPNDTADNRARNRRIEIALLPSAPATPVAAAKR